MTEAEKHSVAEDAAKSKAVLNESSDVGESSSSKPETAQWTGALALSAHEVSAEVVFKQLCKVYNKSPFFKHSGMKMVFEDDTVKGVLDMNDHLIGNTAFKILHGGVAATILDSIGGIVAMGEIYLRGKGTLADRIRQVTHLATTDMRVDYISPGRGTQFIATAEVLRMGRKGCTMRMNLHNNENKLIATAIASYVY